MTIAINLLGREGRPRWPGDEADLAPPVPPSGKARDTVVEVLKVLEFAQIYASARQTARADVPVTPPFGPVSWRNMQLGPVCLEARRVAGEAAAFAPHRAGAPASYRLTPVPALEAGRSPPDSRHFSEPTRFHGRRVSRNPRAPTAITG